jgi:ABC-type multidrug transport system fused ATPase/permease subunit
MLLPRFLDNARTLGFRKRWLATIVALQIGATLFEALGVASIVPALELMRSSASIDRLAETSQGWNVILNIASALGVPVGLGLVLALAYCAIVVRQGFLYIQSIYSAFVLNRLIMTLRQRGLKAFLSAGEAVRSASATGEVVNDLTTELQAAASCFTAGSRTIGYAIMIAGYCAVILLISPTLSAAAIAITGLVGLGLVYVTRRIRTLGRDVVEANQNVTRFLIERLASARLVRLSGTELPEFNAFSLFLDKQRKHVNALQKVLALFGVLLEPLALLFGFVLLYFAVTSRLIGFESLVLFFFILLRLVPIAKELAVCRQGYIAYSASVETLLKRLSALETAKEVDTGTRRLERLDAAVAFESIGYGYGDKFGPQALVDINLVVPARRMTALVGPSGAGKSTLVDLIPRLYTPSTGRITFDGVPQDELSVKSLRQAIAFAPQRPQLFDVTVAEHIRYGKPDATDAEVRRAAELAQALDFIEALPQGFGTRVGNNGDRLSGGQRQRLDLARALVRGAPILILDEPTANLDEESTRLFLAALRKVRRETATTIVVIAHNLEAIEDADQIVVLNGGQVEAVGRHGELMHTEGWYQRQRRAGTGSRHAKERATA